MDLIVAKHLSKRFKDHHHDLSILSNISLTITQSETLAIVGPSGSGKSTLLGLLASLQSPTSGQLSLFNQDISKLNNTEKALLRQRYIGFVFQQFLLLDHYTALENVMLPLELAGQHAHTRAQALLTQLGLGERLTHFPSQLSGGEKQRVAIARAFINQPKILFLDEPTGNLDHHTASHVLDIIFNLHEHKQEQKKTTLVFVTHDPNIAQRCQRIFKLEDTTLTPCPFSSQF